MKTVRRTLRIILIGMTLFLALTTFLGGIALLTNLIAMPLELLQGSPFKSYTVPGLALAVIASGSALLAAILLLRQSRFALLCANTAGVIIMFFEFVEVLIIGSDAGVARTLQILYFGLGTLIVIVCMGIWFLDLVAEPGTQAFTTTSGTAPSILRQRSSP